MTRNFRCLLQNVESISTSKHGACTGDSLWVSNVPGSEASLAASEVFLASIPSLQVAAPPAGTWHSRRWSAMWLVASRPGAIAASWLSL